MSEKTSNWAAFGNEYLKAIEVVSDKDEYAIVGVDSKQEDGKEILLLKLERNEIQKLFGCNKTNLYAVQQECPDSADQAVGRIITFKKVKVTNPQSKQLVDGLRLQFKPKSEPKEVDTDEIGLDEDGIMK